VRRPELTVGGEPLVELGERLRSDAVQAALRIRAGLNEPRVLEDAEVLRHCWLAEAELVDELPDGPLAISQQIEDRQPTRLGQNLERGESCHPDKHAL
jgi:hypothetical protein